MIGSQLLRVTVFFIYAVVTYRVPTIMGRPRAVEYERQAPSSWHLAEIQHSITFSEVTMAHFRPCMLGQVSIKPATLLCVCAQVEALINQQPNQLRCNHHEGYHRSYM